MTDLTPHWHDNETELNQFDSIYGSDDALTYGTGSPPGEGGPKWGRTHWYLLSEEHMRGLGARRLSILAFELLKWVTWIEGLCSSQSLVCIWKVRPVGQSADPPRMSQELAMPDFRKLSSFILLAIKYLKQLKRGYADNDTYFMLHYIVKNLDDAVNVTAVYKEHTILRYPPHDFNVPDDMMKRRKSRFANVEKVSTFEEYLIDWASRTFKKVSNELKHGLVLPDPSTAADLNTKLDTIGPLVLQLREMVGSVKNQISLTEHFSAYLPNLSAGKLRVFDVLFPILANEKLSDLTFGALQAATKYLEKMKFFQTKITSLQEEATTCGTRLDPTTLENLNRFADTVKTATAFLNFGPNPARVPNLDLENSYNEVCGLYQQLCYKLTGNPFTQPHLGHASLVTARQLKRYRGLVSSQLF